MKEEERQAIGKYVMATINAFQQIKEEGESLLAVLGKPYIETIVKPITEKIETDKPTEKEFNSLYWEDKEGAKGAFQQTSKIGNQNHINFRKLQTYLKAHNGFAILHDFKTWLYSSNPDLIGRRKQ